MTVSPQSLPYKIERELGRGGMGVVYLARDTRLGRQVAIKTLVPVGAANEQHRRTERFRREAQILAQLNHPNIAGIYDIAELDEGIWLVMEYVDGPTLMDRITQSPSGIPAAEAISIADDIAAALTAAHEAGIVHGDLKPANIKITPRGAVKVLDFGLARVGTKNEALHAAMPDDVPTASFSSADVDALVAGTPGYMSPEMARGQAVDARADVFALGCVLFEMLTGTKAFQGKTAGEVMASVLLHEPNVGAYPASVPDALRRLIARCLSKEPQKRPASGAAVAEALAEMLGPVASLQTEAEVDGGTLSSPDAADAIPLSDLAPGCAVPVRYLSQLPAAEREALIFCAAFAGGFSAQAASAVVGGAASGVAGSITKLIQWRLLSKETDRAGIERLFMPAALRTSIHQQHRSSDSFTQANHRLMAHLAQWAGRMHGLLDSPAQLACLRDIDADIDTIAGAIAWSAATGECTEQGVLLLSSLREYWEIRGRVGYARTSLEKAFDRGHNRLSPQAQALGLSASGTLAFIEGDMVEAVTLQRKALALRRKMADDAGVAESLLLLAFALIFKEPLTTRNMLQEAIDLGNKLDRRDFVARACLGLSLLSLFTASVIEAQRALLAVGTSRAGTYSPRLEGGIQYLWAVLKLLQNELPEAEKLARECMALHQQIDNQQGIGQAQRLLAAIHLQAGEVDEADKELEEALTRLRSVRDKVEILIALSTKAHLLALRGKDQEAVILWQACDRIRTEMMLPTTPVERLLSHRWLLHSVQKIGDAGFKQAEKTAATLNWHQINV